MPRAARSSRMSLVTRVALTTEDPAVGAKLCDGARGRADGSDEERGAADPEGIELEHGEHEGREQAARGDRQGDPGAVAVDVAIAHVAARVESLVTQAGTDARGDRHEHRHDDRAH